MILNLWMLHGAASIFMTGVIWTMQVVHYPGFCRIGRSEWAAYHAAHTRRITWVVLPVMTVELVTAVALGWSEEFARAGPVLLGTLLLWGLTGGWAAPLHGKLSAQPDPALLKSLLRVNALRTAVWTLKSVWVGVMFWT